MYVHVYMCVHMYAYVCVVVWVCVGTCTHTGYRVFKYLSLWRMVGMAHLNQRRSLLVFSLFHATCHIPTLTPVSLFFSPHLLSLSLSLCSPPSPCVCNSGCYPRLKYDQQSFPPILLTVSSLCALLVVQTLFNFTWLHLSALGVSSRALRTLCRKFLPVPVLSSNLSRFFR